MTYILKPDDVEDKKTKSIPKEVFDAANELIAKNWDGYSSTFKLKLLAKESLELINNQISETSLKKTSDFLFSNNFLDIEGSYRQEGWNVTFEKSGYNETFDDYFVFEKIVDTK